MLKLIKLSCGVRNHCDHLINVYLICQNRFITKLLKYVCKESNKLLLLLNDGSLIWQYRSQSQSHESTSVAHWYNNNCKCKYISQVKQPRIAPNVEVKRWRTGNWHSLAIIQIALNKEEKKQNYNTIICIIPVTLKVFLSKHVIQKYKYNIVHKVLHIKNILNMYYFKLYWIFSLLLTYKYFIR